MGDRRAGRTGNAENHRFTRNGLTRGNTSPLHLPAAKAADNQAGESVFLAFSARHRRGKVLCQHFLRFMPILAGNERFVPPFVQRDILDKQTDSFQFSVHNFLAGRATGAGGIARIVRIAQQLGNAAVIPAEAFAGRRGKQPVQPVLDLGDCCTLVDIPAENVLYDWRSFWIGFQRTAFFPFQLDFLIAKRKLIASQYNQIQSEIIELEKERRIEEQQLSFFDNVETISDIFDKRISSIPINEVAVKKGIAKLEKEIADINLKIRELTQSANSVISSIFNTTKKYLQELGIDESHNTEKYLFTSNLKELSGAILHKTVFAFRLACLLEVEKHLNIKFPIILDSPSGKEIDKQNIEAMVEILKRDFANNQIIIASIYEYRLPNINRISIVNRLIE